VESSRLDEHDVFRAINGVDLFVRLITKNTGFIGLYVIYEGFQSF
jgi:hypothetical protein